MNYEFNRGVLFIRFNERLDHDISYKINSFLIPKILDQKIKYIVFNFYDVESIDDFVIDALLNVKCAIKVNKGKMCICEVSKEIEKKINKAKMKKVGSELNALNLIKVI